MRGGEGRNVCGARLCCSLSPRTTSWFCWRVFVCLFVCIICVCVLILYLILQTFQTAPGKAPFTTISKHHHKSFRCKTSKTHTVYDLLTQNSSSPHKHDLYNNYEKKYNAIISCDGRRAETRTIVSLAWLDCPSEYGRNRKCAVALSHIITDRAHVPWPHSLSLYLSLSLAHH